MGYLRDRLEYFTGAVKSKDGKTLSQNFAYLTLVQVVGAILPFITIPYLSRVVGVSGFGHIAFAAAIIAWVQTIVDWGFNYSATREVSKNRDNVAVLSRIFTDVFWSKVLLSSVCFAILAVLTLFIPVMRQNALIMFFTFLSVPGSILFPEWFFQGLEKMKYIAIVNLLVRVAFTISIFFVIREPDDYIYQPLLMSAGFIVSGIFCFILIRRKWGVRVMWPNMKSVVAYIRGGFDVFLGNLFPTMYNNFSAVLLGAIGGPIPNGLYDGGNKFVSVAQQFVGVFGRTFYPYLSRHEEKHAVYARFNLLLAGGVSVALFLAAPLIVHIFLTPEFESSITVLRIMSFSIFFLGLSTVYCTNYLFVKGYDREARNITIIASMTGFVLAWPMIKWFSFIGAAVNVTFTRALMGIMYMNSVIKHKKQCK